MTTERLRGVIAAVPTPLDEAFEPDMERFYRQARWALDNGCDAINVLGSTGEANSLPAFQRKRVMTTAAIRLGSDRMMVGTGTCDMATTLDLTMHAFRLRYAGALVLPPFYYKNAKQEALYQWFAHLIGATGEAPIPIYLYNIPQMTGLRFEPETVARLRHDFPERIVGIKDSSGDFDYSATVAKIEGLDVFPGSESGLAQAEADGYAGCISATVNETAPLVARLWADISNQALIDEASMRRAAIARLPLVPAVKYLVARRFEDAEFERVLPPHLPLREDEKAQLVETLEMAA
jgi:4-hydroxy-tetrahydrodipicolinate synthase